MLLMCLELLEKEFFLFSWVRLGRGLKETIVFSKAVLEVSEMNMEI